MKRFFLVICVLALVAAPSGASSLGFGVAYMDSSNAGDDNGAGFKLSQDVGSKWNIDVRAAFFDGHGIVQPTREITLEATAIDVGLSYDFPTSGKVTPYLGAGINYNLYKSVVFNTIRREFEASRVKDEPGVYLAAGVEAPLTSRLGIFGEVLYRQNKPSIQGDGLAEFDLIALDFAGAGATVGLLYSW